MILLALLWLPVLGQARMAELLSEQIADEVIDLASNDLTSINHQQMQDGEAAPDNDGVLLGMPTLDQMLSDRLVNVWMNPSYWASWVQQALLDGNVMMPSPTDLFKPELWSKNVHVNNGDYISPLPKALSDTSQLTYEWKGETKTVADFMLATETDVIAFAVNGALLDELYLNGYAPEVRHQPWSITKTFVAATVGIAKSEGHIASLQDPIEKYIPELVGTAWEGATVENILQMESGVFWDEDTPVLPLNSQVDQWIQLGINHYTQGQLGMSRNEYLKSLPKAYEQGEEFHYSSANTQVLGWMLELIYDQPYNQIIEEKIWLPMGAQGDAKMVADRNGDVLSSQGLYARPYDFIRFGEVLRNRGVNSDGKRIIPADWVDAMVQMTDVSNGIYGLQTWVSYVGPKAYSALGFVGQAITVAPSKCLTALRLSHNIGLRYRRGEMDDPDAWGFSLEDGEPEWDSMLRQISEEFPACNNKSATGPVDGGSEVASGGGGASNRWALALLLFAILGRGLRLPLSKRAAKRALLRITQQQRNLTEL